ncbi:MAG: flagellar biosynthesis protein FlhA [Burkholderiaceae bacterium]|nr:flagellar biosynthesis protein FlhA [Burkholderiaceae bacterium]
MSLVGPANAAGVRTLQVGGLTLIVPPVKAIGAPVVILLVLAMMILPLPAPLLDLFFTFNIALSLLVLLVASYSIRPLDFAVFPTVLLVTTLLRLSLNVASTRAVLMHGHTGTDAAGRVIESFATFLVGGNFAVGIIVFSILTVINFVVVTKGAGRIAEVSARFALDAMPGKQMAIDADLNVGQIDQAEARRRRSEVAREADFFGSMDGASKFVRGDAIAGILIVFINIVGGLLIGTAQHALSVEQAANNYVLLAIGDALVAQVPGLVISVAAGLIVSRVADDDDVGGQVVKQLLSLPRALGLTAAVVALLGIVPGMPHFAFLALSALIGWFAWWLSHQQARRANAAPASAEPPPANAEASWDDVEPVDILALEVGYRLISLVDRDNGADLLARIKGVRKKFAHEVGFLPPPVHVRDQLELKPSAYRVLLKGVVVGEGEAFPGMMLAIDPGSASGPIAGTATRDPAFGLPATWIDAQQRDNAQGMGYTVVDAATVVATHLHHLMQTHAARLLGRGEAQQLLEHLGRYAPKLADEIVPKLVPMAVFQKVLQNLLDESVHVRDLRGIVETLGEHGARTQDATELTREVRVALAPAIVQQAFGPTQELSVIAIEPNLENLLVQALAPNAASALEPGVAEYLLTAGAEAAQKQEDEGHPSCLLVPDRIRVPLARLLKKAAPRLRVLGHAEIPDTHSIRIGRLIGEAK